MRMDTPMSRTWTDISLDIKDFFLSFYVHFPKYWGGTVPAFTGSQVLHKTHDDPLHTTAKMTADDVHQ